MRQICAHSNEDMDKELRLEMCDRRQLNNTYHMCSVLVIDLSNQVIKILRVLATLYLVS